MQLSVRNQQNEEVGSAELHDEIFNVEVRPHVLHDVVVMQLANRRRGTSSTLGRSEVRASRRKPWRQKGTGRARAGRRSSPLWRGGGIVFGPKPRSYAYRVPRKVRRAALRQALTLKARSGNLVVLDEVEISAPKTRLAVELLQRLGAAAKALFLVAEEQPNLRLGVRNLQHVKTLPVQGLNAYDLMDYETVICSRAALARVHEVLKP
ncbi:MAG: 50S ribosomal protein L4 [Candidatus Tectomicrobia bacterium]|nr:50S ribosomal protein L4 [Candidatus Tectomicrobia bacterium]